MSFLPPWPDAATLAAMPYWVIGGAAAGLAAIAFEWIVKPGVFGRVVREEPIHVPGAPKPVDVAPPPWSAAGLRAAAIGAVVGGVAAWGWLGPKESQQSIGVTFAIVGVVQSIWLLVCIQRDAPAVGEPPPDDPAETVEARLRGAWGGVAMAAFGVVMAYF